MSNCKTVATKNYFYPIVVLLLASFTARSQQCGNCKEIPRIAGFGFDIKVSEPNKEAGTEDLWPEWKNLFMIASVVSTQIANNEAGCVRITIPPSVDTGGVELLSVGGETFVNLPSNPLISQDLSRYGNYLLTGSITNNSTTCYLYVEVQTACSRKVVTSAQTSFSLSSVAGNISQIAQQAVAQLSPLAEKIKNFELSERQQFKQLSLFPLSWGDPIKITPQKQTLKTNESTPFTIEVKDCDGKPLAGREVYFNETTFEGLKVNGTTGGTVSPKKVVTDANGRANATFTLRGESTEAIIAAHSPGKDVKGCNSILFGDAPINIKYTHSGYVTYTYKGSSGLTTDKKDQTMSYYYTGKENTSITYRASFYGEGGVGSISVSSPDEESGGADIPDLLESGTYNHHKDDYWKNTIICNCAGKGDVTEQKIKATSAGEIQNSSVHFDYNEGHGRIRLDLRFISSNSSSFMATHLPSQSSTSRDELQWPVDFDTMLDKNFSIKREKVGNRTRYTVEGEQTNKTNSLHQSARVKMVIWEK